MNIADLVEKHRDSLDGTIAGIGFVQTTEAPEFYVKIHPLVLHELMNSLFPEDSVVDIFKH